MTSKALNGATHQRRRLTKWVVLGILLGAAFAIALDVLITDKLGKDLPWLAQSVDLVVQGLILGVAAAIGYHLMYGKEESETAEVAIRESVENSLRPAIDDITAMISANHAQVTRELHDIKPEYYPAHVYADSAEPNAVLNSDIQGELVRASDYYFRGMHGTFTAARIKYASRMQPNARVTLLLPDTRDSEGHLARMSDEVNLRPDKYGSVAAASQEMREQVAMAIVGLWSLQKRADIRVLFTDAQFENRVEITPQNAYVCPYDRDRQGRGRYPRTLRFSSESFLYKLLRAEIAGRRGNRIQNTGSKKSQVSVAPDFEIVMRDRERDALRQDLKTLELPADVDALLVKFERFAAQYKELLSGEARRG